MVVLGEGEFGIPGLKCQLLSLTSFGRSRYQFAATMGLDLILMRLDLGFWRTRGREDLFFFFCRGRAILVYSVEGEGVV